MPERRYDDQEIAAIFRVAAEGQGGPPARQEPHDDGLTLAQLMDIGREVGLAPETVAHAAHALEVRGEGRARTWLGLPIGVSRTVQLDRRLSDEEWENFVVRLREVFQARGRTSSDGSLRQWTNGNLQVLLEPTAAGQRVRFSTVNGNARTYLATGLALLAGGALVAVIAALGGDVAHALRKMIMLGAAGGGLFAAGALRLPAWARLRSRQMEALAAQVAGTESSGSRLPPGSPSA